MDRFLETIENTTFVDDTIVIDGKRFINCIFIRCLFIFAGGHVDPDFRKQNFQHCRWTVSGEALETTRFFELIAGMTHDAHLVPITSGLMPNSA